MMSPTARLIKISLLIPLVFGVTVKASSQRLMEKLNRALVAVHKGNDSVYIGWRLLASDPTDISFNLYRTSGNDDAIKLNKNPIVATTDFIDVGANLSKENKYFVKALLQGKEKEASKAFILPASPPVQQYLSVPLKIPSSEQIGRQNITYSANDASVGDLDGDGEYEIILKWDPSNSKNPPQTGLTGNQIIDAYKMDGTLLWRINLGKNIRSGAAYTQFLVYDFDGDGKAELICKTADGTVDGIGKIIGDPNKDWRDFTHKDTYGKVIEGPEYLTVFNGLTGMAVTSKKYIPSRYPIDGWGGIGGNGRNDRTASRSDRFSACVAYLDGKFPSAVMIRGWYGRTVAVAWDFRDGKLTQRWIFDSSKPEWKDYSGMANHHVSVADFDNDGKDEICVGAMTIDNNGKGLYTTGLRHGDALHVGDLDPNRPGLEVFGIHESEGRTVSLKTPGSALFDGHTGEIIWSNNPGIDVARGLAADIDPRYPGLECWGAPGGTRRVDTGDVIYEATPNSTNFALWWDADPLRELLDKTSITKWDWEEHISKNLLLAEGVASNNGTKSSPCLTADILGDWREEVIWRSQDNTELRIYTTIIPAQNRRFTFMQDPQYRLAIAWQNVGYNQPPHPSFFVGSKIKNIPEKNIPFSLDSLKFKIKQ